MGERRLSDGSFLVFYRLIADGSRKELIPGSIQTPEQRAATIRMIEVHLGEIEKRRNPKRNNQ